MPRTQKLSLPCLASFVMLLALLGGCETLTKKPDVGVVVMTPQVKLPPPPTIVQLTLPKPAGYFQSQLLDYSNGLLEKPLK